MTDALGYYKILEVAPDAAADVIKRQFYEKAKYWHPDHNTDSRAVEFFQKVSVAYDVLHDERLRLHYDLLSLIYTAADFPTMGSLKIYKNQKGGEDAALRVLKQRRVAAGKVRESKDVCNIYEAANMVMSTAMANWLHGWWGKNGLHNTISAIKYNLGSVSADDFDNFKLLLHNAVAYDEEKNSKMAWIYAMQALSFCAPASSQEMLLQRYITLLDYTPDKKIHLPHWQAADLRRRQYLFPFALGLIIVIVLLFLLVSGGFLSFSAGERGYYEQREISGKLVATDMMENRILKVDSSVYDSEYLLYLTADAPIYFGPDTRYDVMTSGHKGQTVRITGHTADKSWYQVIVDNGEKGYIAKDKVAKGMGDAVPWNSYVYKEKLN